LEVPPLPPPKKKGGQHSSLAGQKWIIRGQLSALEIGYSCTMESTQVPTQGKLTK